VLDRHKADNRDRTNYTAGATAWTIANVAATGDTSFYGNQFTFGNRIDYDAARAYFLANPAVGKVDTAGSLSATLASTTTCANRSSPAMPWPRCASAR
jgi:hypothetical protein